MANVTKGTLGGHVPFVPQTLKGDVQGQPLIGVSYVPVFDPVLVAAKKYLCNSAREWGCG